MSGDEEVFGVGRWTGYCATCRLSVGATLRLGVGAYGPSRKLEMYCGVKTSKE
mgnify:CR=1 FL=1